MAPYQPGKMPSNHDLRDVFKLQHKPDSFTALHKCPAKISLHLLLWTRTTTTMCVGIFPHAKQSHANLHRANIIYLYVCFRLHILCTNMRWVFTITMLLLHQCMTVCVCEFGLIFLHLCVTGFCKSGNSLEKGLSTVSQLSAAGRTWGECESLWAAKHSEQDRCWKCRRQRVIVRTGIEKGSC